MQNGFAEILQKITDSDLPQEDKVLCCRRIRRRYLATTLPCDSVWTVTRRSIVSDEILDSWTCDAGNGGACLDELRRVLCSEEGKPGTQKPADRKIARILHDEFTTSDWKRICQENYIVYYQYLRALGEGLITSDHWYDKDTRPSISNWEDHYGKNKK